ncbi:MAG: D-alanine--D-alanine ligase [Bacteroidales bacterium]|nr:D-alanine--D-alanine ligase [Bacteroidales bacterium]
MKKRNIAVIAGGDSGEYDISIKSGSVVAEMLDKNRFNAYLIQIKGSDWFYAIDGQKFKIDKNDFSLTIDENQISFDCVFCAIHGTPGENGKLPAYFEMLKIPFTSSDSLVSAITFNKNFCNRIVSTFGVAVSSSIHLAKGQHFTTDQILDSLSLPVFVKPNAGGSSVGMSKVKNAGDLSQAIRRAFEEDDEVLIEEFIEGRELTCGALSNKGKMIVFPICEIKSKKEFFDYEAKYNPALADEIVPADIFGELEIHIKQTTAMIYNRFKCKGVVRADYIYSEKDETLYFIEINTVPGLTRESIVPKMAGEMGISLTELFGMMVEDAMER